MEPKKLRILSTGEMMCSQYRTTKESEMSVQEREGEVDELIASYSDKTQSVIGLCILELFCSVLQYNRGIWSDCNALLNDLET
jgi:hypothetical protein